MYESLRLFAMCNAMNWCHLPWVGGLYDQHPRMLEEWAVIFQMKGEYERQEHERAEREMERKSRMR